MAGTIFSSWDNPEYEGRNEIVFATRNKDYGAFVIRKLYDKRVINAFIIAVVGVVFLISLPLIIEAISGKMDDMKKATQEVVVDLTAPPPVDPAEPPPPPPPPPPPVQQTIKFVPPVVVDKPVEEEAPPPQEKLEEVAVGEVTQEGTGEEIAPPAEVVADPDAGKIFTVVEEMPQFPGGGEAALLQYLRSNIKYPPLARENGIEGTVYVTFIVDKDGKVKEPKLLRGVTGLDEEALRVISRMPDWKPGKQNGRTVAVQYNLPVRFTLK
ncbi:MAG: energy transducer TonB [Bacteroidota bacterium]